MANSKFRNGVAFLANMFIAGTLIYTMVRIIETTPPNGKPTNK